MTIRATAGGAIRRSTSAVSGVATTLISRRPTPRPRLARKGPGKEAKLSFAGHVLMENRNGLAVDVLLTEADGYAERRAALEMLRRRGRRVELLWVLTRAMTAGSLWPAADSSGSRRTWPATRTSVEARLMDGRRDTLATRRVSAYASGSRRSSAG